MRTIVGLFLVLLLATVQVSAMGLIAPQETSARVDQARNIEFIVRGDGSSRTIRFFTSAPDGWATFNGTSNYREVQDTMSGYSEKRYAVEVVPRKAGLLKITWGVKVSGGGGVGMDEVLQDVLQLQVSNPSGGGDVVVTVPSTTSSSKKSSSSGGGGGVVSVAIKNASVPKNDSVGPVPAVDLSGDAQGVGNSDEVSAVDAVDLKEEFAGTGVVENGAGQEAGAVGVPISREKFIAFGVVMLGLIAVFVQVLFLRTWRREDA